MEWLYLLDDAWCMISKQSGCSSSSSMRQAAQLLLGFLSVIDEAQLCMFRVMCMRVFALANVLALLVGEWRSKVMQAYSCRVQHSAEVCMLRGLLVEAANQASCVDAARPWMFGICASMLLQALPVHVQWRWLRWIRCS
jgi:hypothetical protein